MPWLQTTLAAAKAVIEPRRIHAAFSGYHNPVRAFDLTLPARAQSLRIVREALDELPGVTWTGQSTLLDDMRIAVTEACANVVMHAYPGRDDGVLQVTGDVDGGRFQISVRDDGHGIRPRPDSPGLGIGLPLIVALTDVLEIGPGSHGGNDVRMTFRGRPRPL